MVGEVVVLGHVDTMPKKSSKPEFPPASVGSLWCQSYPIFDLKLRQDTTRPPGPLCGTRPCQTGLAGGTNQSAWVLPELMLPAGWSGLPPFSQFNGLDLCSSRGVEWTVSYVGRTIPQQHVPLVRKDSGRQNWKHTCGHHVQEV